MSAADTGRILRFAGRPGDVVVEAEDAAGRWRPIWLILDSAWTPSPADRAADRLALRELAAAVLGREDLFPVTTRLLNDWAEAAGVADAMAVDGTSFWYRRRLWAWRWLHERLIWIAVLDQIARQNRLAAIELPVRGESALREVVRLLAARDGLAIRGDEPGETPVAALEEGLPGRADSGGTVAAEPGGHDPPRKSPLVGILSAAVRSLGLRPVDRRRKRIARRRAAMARRLAALSTGRRGRLLVITDPATHQPIAEAGGIQMRDPFLGPVVERLTGTVLDPILVELGSRAEDDETWARLSGSDGRRILSGDVLRAFAEPHDEADAIGAARNVRDSLAGIDASLSTAGMDLGPDLTAALVRYAEHVLPARLREVARMTRLLRALRPACLLTIDEYGRTEWLSAARRLAIPVAAVQHGIIHPWHPGYQHQTRPDVRPVPDRTYTFGAFERRLLIERGAYRADEVVVVGSPRLDLVAERPPASELEELRAAFGVRPDDRMLVVSTTFAAVYRRFYTPVVLAALLGEPLPGVRVVVKLHPGEDDGVLYEQLLAGLATAGHRQDVAIVKRVDLYRLLAAADAHLGIYSTVLTEAVVTGTRNLVAATQATSDLLGYVASGVALPVASGADIAAALAGSDAAPDPELRRKFLDDHFQPGPAADRIAADLIAWLAPREQAPDHV